MKPNTCEDCNSNRITFCARTMGDIVDNEPVNFICPLERDYAKTTDNGILTLEFLTEHYLNKRMSTQKIADITGVTRGQVWWAIKKAGIEFRDTNGRDKGKDRLKDKIKDGKKILTNKTPARQVKER